MKCATIFVQLAVMLVAVSAMPNPRPPIPPVLGAAPATTSWVPPDRYRGRRSPVGKIAIDQPITEDPKVSATYVDIFYANQKTAKAVFGEASKSSDKKAEAVGGIRVNLHGAVTED